MATLDVDRLLQPVSEDSPCGPNLEYDDAYAEFERAGRGTPEVELGEFKQEAEPPKWEDVYRLGVELIERTKDLRIVCLLARGALDRNGLAGFADCLALVRGYIEQYWPTVHPQLDPDDDNDPTLRVNTVASLNNQATIIQSLRAAKIVALRGIGSFSLRDLGIATGEIPPGPNEERHRLETIEAAFSECPIDELKANTDVARQSLDHLKAIDSLLTDHVGSSNAVSMDALRSTLMELLQVLSTHLGRRDSSLVVAGDDGEAADQSPAEGGQSGDRGKGDIRSREDVVAALDRICQYYNRYEPSSPVPLLLTRAKRLVVKNFLEIVRDLTPDALAQIQKLSGVSEDEDSD